jgi:hypothetical protein
MMHVASILIIISAKKVQQLFGVSHLRAKFGTLKVAEGRTLKALSSR